jgi:hypothetical protein
MRMYSGTTDYSFRTRWFLVLGFLILATIYYAWTWSHVLGEFGGDNAIYILTAHYFSPWSGHSDVAAYFAKHSQYPPLFPFALAIFGGGENLLIAHIVTTTCLLLALIVFYNWLTALGFSTFHAILAGILVAVLPGTYMEALSVHSENLYLLSSLAGLLAISLAEKTDRAAWYWMGALCIAAATLTRGAGVSIIAAFACYLALRRPPRALLYVLVSILPMVIWQLLWPKHGPSYLDSFTQKYSGISLGVLVSLLGVQLQAMWYGWVGNFSASSVGLYVMSVIGVVCLMGAMHRIYLKTIDGFYVASYLILILVWPFPAEARRFIFVIMPVLLVQGLLFLKVVPGKEMLHRFFDYRVVMILSIFLIALPVLVLNAARFMYLPPENLGALRHSLGWYALDPREALGNIAFNNALASHLRQIKSLVPTDSCIYSIKPSIVAFYADRISMIPPRENLDDKAFRDSLKETGCRFFYLMGFSSPSFSKPYYPADRLQGSLKILNAVRFSGEDKMPVGALAELVDP